MSEPVSSPNSSPPAPIPENLSPSNPWPVPSPYSSPPAPPAPAIPPPPNISEAGGVSTGLVVGSVLGGLVVIVVLSSLFVLWWCKRKKTRDDEAPPPPAPKVDSYGGRQNDPPPASHVTQPPKPSPHPPLASHPPQSQVHKSSPSLSQPRFTSSSGGSGSTYSGSDVSLPPPSPGIALGFLKTIFTYEELARATDGFSDAKLLGQGGFGYVHKGVLPNGKEVAVKQLKAESRQGEREFRAEIEIISRIHHRHLVSLLGYSISGLHRLLVYEFVPNNTLEFHLHGKGRPTMDWPTRLKIALGSAKGFAYLHEDCHPKIIHRDIKAANILLDFKLDAKVADFGLAKFFPDDNTHVSTRVMGTFGYMAPEYASIGKLTEKSDVFSFGVMLLELITGRQPIISTDTSMEESLAVWARPLLYRAIEYGNLDALVDPKLQNEYNHNEMTRMVACAAACVRHSAHRRPRMSHIVRALEGDVSLSALNEGISPGQSNGYDSKENSDYYIMQYNEDFRKIALNSQESRASGYGLNPSGSSSEDQNTREMEAKKMKKHS